VNARELASAAVEATVEAVAQLEGSESLRDTVPQKVIIVGGHEVPMKPAPDGPYKVEVEAPLPTVGYVSLVDEARAQNDVEKLVLHGDSILEPVPSERRSWRRRQWEALKSWIRANLEIERDLEDFVSRDQMGHRRFNDLLAKYTDLEARFGKLEAAHLDLVGDFNTWIGHLTPYEKQVLSKRLRSRRRQSEGSAAAASAIVKAEEGAAAAGRPLEQASEVD
jgi:hypothetical protein